MKILVLGGTRFFGRRLVNQLLSEGHDVSIATRGVTEDNFGDKVGRFIIDRNDADSLEKTVENDRWDIVYDQICYSPNQAIDSCMVFDERTDKYVFTSSESVYDFSEEPLTEEDFNPFAYSILRGDQDDFSYKEGKRIAEAILMKASFPVVAVRFPIVLGADDYTNRLFYYIEQVYKEKPIFLPNIKAKLSFISSEEAASFLKWAGQNDIKGPVNACSSEVSLEQLINLIEKTVNKKATIINETTEDVYSPYALPESWVMATNKAQKAGFTFSKTEEWLPELVEKLFEGIKK
ncbi:NAD-dependent epimerase/dehydratase family protein [Pseudalkalibacillus caeni]|uniref:UDP-glucose 4-epimerase n=1 Tax=Exobacillus caeni TaxID=2574798 RepID=A0A5R9EWC2_9BACL|nr:NAD-dependent epimerase/dehydratase family protein [Pseudalkalibacillus caeni]TLS34939.1 NAD-dependent epimerase/dehydratase family protein [Pseudalkalibacillus caeni]